MATIHTWLASLTEAQRLELFRAGIATAIAAAIWLGRLSFRALRRAITELIKKHRDGKIHKLARQVRDEIKHTPGALVGYSLEQLAAYFRVRERKLIPALRLLKAQGFLHPNGDESVWYSDSASRFFSLD
jgi:hypothetical protein